MVACLHSSKYKVEREWEEKYIGFLQDHDWFLVKRKVTDWVERNFFSLTVFGGNLLAGDVHSRVTMDRHAPSWQWIVSTSLLETRKHNLKSTQLRLSCHDYLKPGKLSSEKIPEATKQLLKSHFGMVFSCKFAAYFQNTIF